MTPEDAVRAPFAPTWQPFVVPWFHAPPGSEARWVESEKHETAGRAG